ncbi:tellurium resistance protein TerD [Microbacterium sp. 77mftsu3.1]|nr:tellurium resistance protein TerD [Microbacterium sp. 77mftsu3.1]
MDPVTSPRILELGQNIALSTLAPGLDDITVGFGWDITQPTGPQVELVPAVMLLDQDGRAYAADALAFHNQIAAADGAVLVTGDDQEQIDVALTAIPEQVAKLVFVAFVDPDTRKPGTFDTVRAAHVRLLDRSGAELVRFTLPTQAFGTTATNFGELYRHNGAWKFRALGDGYKGGVAEIAGKYGFTLA